MNYFEFLKYHYDQKQIHTLYNAQFWVSCVYLTYNNTLIKNTPPMKVEFDVHPTYLDFHGRPVIDIFKVDAQGKRLKTRVSPQDYGGHYIHVFDTERKASENYTSMLNNIKDEVHRRQVSVNNKFNHVKEMINNQSDFTT